MQFVYNPMTKLTLAAALAAALIFASGLEARPITNAEPSEEFEIVAEVQLDGAKVVFIDETIDGIFGFGILEEGKINLAPFYEQGASALEIFLALAPKGSEVPAALHKAHEMARLSDPGLGEEPRRDLTASGPGSVAAKALSYYTFDHDTSNCWEWGGLMDYDDVEGNEPGTFNGHDSSDAYDEFRDWSGISGFGVSASAYYDEQAELGDQTYATPYGNDRALAICVTHAIVQPGEDSFECSIENGTYENTVRYRIRLRGQQGASTWATTWFYLEGYGEGSRYRSSSSADRKYTLDVHDLSRKSLTCKERYEVFTRSKNPLAVGGTIILGF